MAFAKAISYIVPSQPFLDKAEGLHWAEKAMVERYLQFQTKI